MRIFKEEQRFTQTWLLVLLAISVIAPLLIITKEYLAEDSTMSSNEFILTLVAISVSIGFIFFFRLSTRIDEKGIHYQFFPVHFSIKTIGWSEINSAIIRNYDPIGDYGGWGIKGGSLWGEKGKSITISGDIGIQLKLKNRKLLLIGTQKKSEASKVLENYQEKIINEA